MNTLVAIAVAVCAGLLFIYLRRRPPTARRVPMYPVIVGEKTDLYEVVAHNELRLAPGVKFQHVQTPGGNNGIVLLKPGGGGGRVGGFFSCGCVGAQTGNCVTTSDNPDHPSCSGSCTDSEGNPHPCSMYGPIIGPPKDPIIYLRRP